MSRFIENFKSVALGPKMAHLLRFADSKIFFLKNPKHSLLPNHQCLPLVQF